MNQIEQSITSLEVADMLEVRHSDVLSKLEGNSKLKGIIPTLSERNIPSAEYFKESTYTDAQGKERKCYNITKMGCDFLANKFTGEKGILFTAKYVKKFHDMESSLALPLGNTRALIQILAQGNIELEQKIDGVQKDMNDFKMELPLLAVDCDRITNAVKSKGVKFLGGKNSNAYSDKSLRQRVYSDIHREVKRQFGVTTYKAIRRNQCDKAVAFIGTYDIPFVLQDEIADVNSQTMVGKEVSA